MPVKTGGKIYSMEKRQYHINTSAPNLVNICVDGGSDGEISGRLYHRYSAEPAVFVNLMQLLRLMEDLYDGLSFPQASTRSRSFFAAEAAVKGVLKQVVTQEKMMRYAGEEATFLVSVRFRQNSTWQGEMFWVEGGEIQDFSSTLDLIKIMDAILSVGKPEE